MDYGTALDIWRGVEGSQQASLRLDLVRAAIDYSNLRVQWKLAMPEQRVEMDASRSRSHNAFIDTCNILSRNMLKAGENNDWRNTLGDDRKAIGDFACYIVLFLGLSAR